jgi:phosphatidylglycerol:prolipoprotein diacylglycerol transferase
LGAPEAQFPNLHITINTLPRIAFHIGSVSIYWYGICIVLGVIAGTLWAVHEAKRIGHNPDHYTDFVFYALIFSLIGARLYYVIFSWNDYKNNLWSIFAIRQGGLAIYGGVIAAFITAIVYTRIRKLNFWAFVDVAAPCLILGQAIGRWGNFFNREVFGHFTNGLFAMRYLASQVSVIPPSVAQHIVEANGAQYIQVQPTFLYESLLNLCIFFLMAAYKRHKKLDGEIILMYLFGYGIVRFVIEGIRTDQLMLFNTGIPVSQLLSAVLAVAAVIIFIARRAYYRGKPVVLNREYMVGYGPKPAVSSPSATETAESETPQAETPEQGSENLDSTPEDDTDK